MTKAELIQKHAERLRHLQDEVHKFRKEGDTQRWEEASRAFFDAYERLAIPGGLTESLNRLKDLEATAIDDAVTFLEADPFFFRSGYIKEEILGRLRAAPLDPGQKKRLQQVILARVRDTTTKREFRRYCALAPYVSDAFFEEEITTLAGSSGEKPNRAQWVLDRLRQGIPKR